MPSRTRTSCDGGCSGQHTYDYIFLEYYARQRMRGRLERGGEDGGRDDAEAKGGAGGRQPRRSQPSPAESGSAGRREAAVAREAACGLASGCSHGAQGDEGSRRREARRAEPRRIGDADGRRGREER